MPVRVPSYRRHKQSGQAIATLPDGLGDRRDVLLGKHVTAKSRAEYALFIAKWEANGRTLPAPQAEADPTLSELIVASGSTPRTTTATPTAGRPVRRIMSAWPRVPLRELYGHTPATAFDSLGLKAVRGRMVEMGHCRGQVNKDAGRIRRAFKWAAG